MAKSPLFSRLGELSSLTSLARSSATLDLAALRAQRREQVLTRRVFLERALLGLCAVPLGRALTGCGEGGNGRGGADEARVAIIGGGIAGLSCAYQLELAGLTATVYEASKRTGGRMFTERSGFGGQVAERGGELIDSGHLTLRSYAKQLGIRLDDRKDPAFLDEVEPGDVWWIDGQRIPEQTLVEQFSEVAPLMARQIEKAEKDDAYFSELDRTPLDRWLDMHLSKQPQLKAVLENAYRGEYGLELPMQSALNMLYLIGSDDPDPFRIFGISDERFHTHRGSQTFPEELASTLSRAPLLQHRLVRAADGQDGTTRLTFDTPQGELTAVADFVVFALPFSVLRKVDLEGLSLSKQKREIIDTLGYGTNAKVMGSFERRVWLEDHDSDGSVTSDAPFQQTWDTAIGQAGKRGLLTNFLGGEQGERSNDGSAEAWFREVVLKGVESVFPGVTEAYVKDSAVRMHWPSYPFSLGSYACYLPGQWAFYGLEGLSQRKGRLLFCGEHTSLEFQGYMEGGAETGVSAAAAILDALDLAPAESQAALMATLQVVPRPAFGAHVRAAERRSRARQLDHAVHALAGAVR